MSRVLLLGASGSIGRMTANALLRQGYDLTCLLRAGSAFELPGAKLVQQADDLAGFDAVVSCMASRTGKPRDAWAVDYQAHSDLLKRCVQSGVSHFVLLSAICVQRPILQFQQAKLAFEAELIDSGLTYSIVRPTAYFKSLCGQIDRLRAGKPYMMFGDGRLTACKPISNADLADFIVGCLSNPDRHNKILPIGGPGPAITPKDIGDMLFRLLNKQPKFRSVRPGFLSGLAKAMAMIGLKDKAEFARIGHYYGTQSMLLWQNGRYDADATPEHGSDRLEDYAAALIRGDIKDERGDHAVF